MKLSFAVFVFFALGISVFAASYCDALSQYQKKAEYYRGILNSPEKAAELNISSEQVARVVNSLSTSLAKAEQMCERERAAASAQETGGSSAANVGTAARTATANTENANDAAIEARQKAADSRAATANTRLNVTATNTATNTRMVRGIDTEDDAVEIVEVEAVAASSASAATGTNTGALSRFAYWWGKVTMVQTSSGGWEPAQNMRDGANINPLTYCRQLNSRSEGVRELGKTTISGWINRDGNADSQGRTSYTEPGVVYECLPYRAFEVKTQLNPNVPLFTAPDGEEGTSAASGAGSTAVRANTAAIASARATATSDEVVAPVGTSYAGDVSDYYKQKMQEILQKDNNIDAQITSLKRLSGEINSLVASLLEQKSRIALNEEGMKELVKSVRITPTKVSTGDVEVEAKGKIIEARTSARKAVEVEAKEGKVVLRDNGVEAEAKEISVTSDTISVGGADVKITPSDAAKKVNAVSKKISIAADKDNKAQYNVQAQTKARIMGVLPVTLNRTVEIDSQTGNIISDIKPWWSIVTIEDAVQNSSQAQ